VIKINQVNQMSIETYDSSKHSSLLIEELRALIKYRELIMQFVSRAIKTRYKRSILGVLWTMLNPLLMMLVLTMVFSAIFRFSVKNYSVYILSGLTAWNFFSSSTSIAMGEMMWSGGLLARIFVPKSVFAVSSIGTGLVNLLIALIPLFVISIALGVPIRPSILVMPVAILLLAMFALGIALLLSTVAVYFADMLPIYEVLLTLWLYSTPIIYPVDIVPESLSWLFRLNPMYYLVYLYRTPLYDGVVPGLRYWLIGGGFALAAFILGGLTFTAKSHEYAYRI
jgi:ABC-type polysaccharide/polyol phosphate export permease